LVKENSHQILKAFEMDPTFIKTAFAEPVFIGAGLIGLIFGFSRLLYLSISALCLWIAYSLSLHFAPYLSDLMQDNFGLEPEFGLALAWAVIFLAFIFLLLRILRDLPKLRLGCIGERVLGAALAIVLTLIIGSLLGFRIG